MITNCKRLDHVHVPHDYPDTGVEERGQGKESRAISFARMKKASRGETLAGMAINRLALVLAQRCWRGCLSRTKVPYCDKGQSPLGYTGV